MFDDHHQLHITFRTRQEHYSSTTQSVEGPSDHEAKPRRHRRWEMSGPHETLQHLTPAPRKPASMVFATKLSGLKTTGMDIT